MSDTGLSTVEGGRSQAQRAQDWLAAAQRPLRPLDLWAALRVGEIEDVDELEDFLTASADLEENAAIEALSALLGSAIAIYPDAGGRQVVALASQGGEKPSATAQAHSTVARACMAICTRTMMHLTHLWDRGMLSSIITYAWTYWSTHFTRSTLDLGDPATFAPFKAMVVNVQRDILTFLVAVNAFLTGPITLPIDTTLEIAVVAAVRDAQQALDPALQSLSELVVRDEWPEALESARRIFGASSLASKGNLPAANLALVPASSALDVLNMDLLVAKSEHLFGEEERHAVTHLAEAARGLRRACVSLSRSPLHEELLGASDAPWSPSGALYYAATWVEEVASYPYWRELSGATWYRSFKSVLAADPSEHACQLVLERLWTEGAAEPPKTAEETYRAGCLAPVRPASVSRMRWAVALQVYSLKATGRGGAASFTINDPSQQPQRASSFSQAPAALNTGSDALDHALALLPAAIPRFFGQRLGPVARRLRDSGFFKSLDNFSSGAFTGGLPALWPQTKAAVLVDGYRSALMVFGLAILINHVRRMLVPWLGVYMFRAPLEDLRLALARPDVFLDSALSFTWAYSVFMTCQKYAFDFVGQVCVGLLAANGGRLPPDTQATLAGASPRVRAWFDRGMVAARVLYLVWALGSLEYMLDRTLNTAAFTIAAAKLVRGGDAEHIALGHVLRQRWLHAAFTAYQVSRYAWRALWPTLWAGVLSALLGQPGLLLALGGLGAGVWAVLRHRARLYIALEMSGLLLVLGLAVAVWALLALEFVEDPAGLAASTARARRATERALRALEGRGSADRLSVLRREKEKGPAPAAAEAQAARARDAEKGAPEGVSGPL